jgi:Bacterial Ig domain
VTGFAKAATGTINLRSFLHESGNMTNVYSDRIAETPINATGGIFSFYLTTKTTASDANITFETSNQSINYELDSLSIRRMNAVVKNTNANEVLIFSNTGSSSYSQACPGGVPCFAYIDGMNSSIGWPINIPAYTTNFVLWNNSPNILNTPSCNINISAGSVPTGQPVDINWMTTNANSQILNYETYTGMVTQAVSNSGMITFIPAFDGVTTISIDTINDVWPKQCSIQVTTTNTSPSIFPGTTTGSEDSPQIDGTLSGVDLNPWDTVFFESLSTPLHGSLNLDSSGSFQYFPNSDYCWNDTFDFRAADQLGHYADPVTQTLQVACINDTPVAVNNSWSAIAWAPFMINVLANDTDVDSPYQVQVFTIDSISPVSNGVASISSNQVQYTPNVGFNGTEIFSYRMKDQSGALSNTGIITISVTVANTAPTASGAIYTTNEDVTLADSLSGSDNEGNLLAFTASTLPLHGTLTLLLNGMFSYIPNTHYFWNDSFNFTVNDGTLSSASATINIVISSVPDAPVATGDSYSLNQDTTLFIPVMMNDSDIDSSTLTLTWYINPLHGTITVSGTGFDYTPTTGYIGSDSFTYKIADEAALVSNTATVTLNVVSTNVAPTANSGSFATNEDIILNAVLSATDPENSTLMYIVDIFPTQWTLTLSSTGIFSYTPNLHYFWNDSFVFHVSDGSLVSSGATVTLAINSINDIPVANSTSLTATGNSVASSGNILIWNLSGSDIESVWLYFTASTLPIYWQLTISSTGALTYLPALGYTGSDSFSFTVSDGSATSTSALVNITIVDNGIAPPPPVPLVFTNLSLIYPATVYSGQPLSVTVQAKNNTNTTVTTYTWSIVFTSPTNTGATLPSSGGPIVYTLSDSGTKTFTNTLAFSRTGSMVFVVRDILTNISATGTVIVSDTPIVPPPPPNNTGWWGWQSIPVSYNIITVSSSGEKMAIKNNNIELNSASDKEPQPVFVMQDPSGLLGQLFLTNRYLGGIWYQTMSTDKSVSDPLAGTIIDSLNTIMLDEIDGPMILRQIAQIFVYEASQSEDPIALYDYGMTRIKELDTMPDSRLANTQSYVLRIFERQKKRYEETVYRNIVGRLEESLNSASEDIEELKF